jgi:hypothetical protein
MGRIEKDGEKIIYRQDDGEVTARFSNFEEKMELGHEGTKGYKKIFCILVLIGFLYLGIIFLLF